MVQLIHLLLAENWSISYASTASSSEHSIDLLEMGIAAHHIQLNSSTFDSFITQLNPNIVIFDRFMVEEQFGWRVAECCPEALRILDTEDLHCLRLSRQDAFKEGIAFSKDQLFNRHAFREIASIYRCDLSLIISKYEIQLLQDYFGISNQLLHYIPFLLEPLEKPFEPFENRTGFVTIGNFLHPPNWAAIQALSTSIWPEIKRLVPEATLDVYGAYATEKVWQLHHPKKGFYIKGRAEDALESIKNYKVLLSPLPYGAGIKGKLIDAMQAGTPSITTPIGAEGIPHTNWPGAVVPYDSTKEFVKEAIAYYTDDKLWKGGQAEGMEIINTHFQKKHFATTLIKRLKEHQANQNELRKSNFIGAMLQHHGLQSTKYLAKWIEEKNR